MNKTKKTIKINNYINIEYEPEDTKFIKIYYTSKFHAYDVLYDTNKKRFFAFSTLHDFFTNTQKKLVLNAIDKITTRREA